MEVDGVPRYRGIEPFFNSQSRSIDLGKHVVIRSEAGGGIGVFADDEKLAVVALDLEAGDSREELSHRLPELFVYPTPSARPIPPAR